MQREGEKREVSARKRRREITRLSYSVPPKSFPNDSRSVVRGFYRLGTVMGYYTGVLCIPVEK